MDLTHDEVSVELDSCGRLRLSRRPIESTECTILRVACCKVGLDRPAAATPRCLLCCAKVSVVLPQPRRERGIPPLSVTGFDCHYQFGPRTAWTCPGEEIGRTPLHPDARRGVTSFRSVRTTQCLFLLPAQPRSLAASPATCRPWKRAMASSLAVGERSPLGPAMVVAP